MSTTKVILADDEAIIRMDLKEALVEEGYEVIAEAGNGVEALELVKTHRPDVAIVDIKMPYLDGLELARQIMAERLTAVVILTAFSQRELIEQASDVGALAYLVKPYRDSDLVPTIELALARFKELSALSEQSEQLSNKLEARKVIDTAKGFLMDKFSMAEGEAFRFLQTTAMSRRASMRHVSEEVLAGELSPPSAG